MSTNEGERVVEQKYFDRAWNQRERHRTNLKGAGEAAAGSQAAARAVRQDRDRLLDNIAGPDEPIALGRIDLEDDDETFYLGKHAIFDEDGELLVVAWQMKAVAGFYEASAADPRGVRRKRTFETDRNEILSFEDILYADLAARIDSLNDDERRGVDDALLRDLELDRTGEMRDIVQTIHESQYDLIRRPLESALVVQGGPGTGKTAVALHRASWLLFHHHETLQPGDVLVVGPSRTFGRYIEKVLPGLGNEGVRQRALSTLGPVAGHDRAETSDVARLKGDDRMAGLLARGLAQRIRFPERSERLEVGSGTTSTISLAREDVETALERSRQAPTYAGGRRAMRDWLNRATSNEARERRRGSFDATSIDNALERVWPQLTPAAFLQDLLGSRPRITAAAGDDFTAGDIDRLYRQQASKLANETWSSADVALMDEVDELINGRGDAFGHVIVDEAQDLSPMQLRSIQRRTRDGSCTVVGDIAQSTGPWARSSWDDILLALGERRQATVEVLPYGYRVPRQIMELANRLLPLVAPDLRASEIVRTGPSDPDIVTVEPDDLHDAAIDAARAYAANGNFVGVVSPESDIDALKDAMRDLGMVFTDVGSGQLGNSINVMTAAQSKGLEFDSVVVLEPAEIAGGEAAAPRGLYIALTRSTKHLTIVHSRPFAPIGLDGGRGDDADISALAAITTPIATADTHGVNNFDPTDRPLPIAQAAAPHASRHGGPGGGTLRERMLRVTASMIADDVRGADVDPESYEELVRLVAVELGVNLSADPGQLF